ncbi:hypothetical protein SAE01_23980 [Segetibacter aerophilus]|uniref:Uncharacterized protein n=1 Tax=Segetibacter aerophilus TaxID=670293 RepID=A0A512BD67_9BACT|nr:hypothetical protein SAE01_23980 [Segetibacter aerophilus]
MYFFSLLNQRLKTETAPATKIVNGTKNTIEEENKALSNQLPSHMIEKHKKDRTAKNIINKKDTLTTLRESSTSLGKNIASSYLRVETQVRIDEILTKR